MVAVPERARPGSWGVEEPGEMLAAIQECREGGGRDRYWGTGYTGPWHEEEE